MGHLSFVGRAAGALLLASALLAGPAMADSVKEEIDTSLAKFSAAFNAGDAAGVAALYTEDGVLLPPGAERSEGRKGVQDFWQGLIDAGGKDLSLQAEEVQSDGALAYEVGRFSLKVPDQDGAAQPVAGKYIVVWKQGQDGRWRLHRDIWNMDPAPATQ